jgi:hypothetical protein
MESDGFGGFVFKETHKTITGEPLGFPNQTDSQIGFNSSTRTFSIQPVATNFSVYCKSDKFTFTSAQSVVLPNTTGLYYIYFNTVGQLSYKTTYFDWPNDAMVAYVYWNASTGSAPLVADERHGVTLDWQTHEYLHRTRGAVLASGFGISNYVLGGDGSLESHMQLDLAGGTFFDEDLEVSITHSDTPVANTWQQDLQGPARIPVFYLSGTAWVVDAPTNYPIKQGTLRPQYNALNGGTWSTADVADAKYGTSWIIATNNINYPVIAIIGQSASDNVGAAEALNFADLNLQGFPVLEFRPLYKLVYRCSVDYANSVNARIDSVRDLRVMDPLPASTTYNPTDHGYLSGLTDDDHLQYVHISAQRTISANHTFSGSVSFTGSPTTTTPAVGDNSTRVASTAFVQSAIAALVDAAPGALDTLNELAAAIGDDANFAATITTALAGKQPLSSNLTAIDALAGNSGFLKKSGLNTWILDTAAYLTGESDPVFLASPAGAISAGEINNWNAAYAWGNHASASYLTTGVAASTYQAKDSDLTAIAGLVGTSGFLKKTAADSWALDTSVYLTGITGAQVTSALGYTPLSNATSYLPLSGGTLSGSLSVNSTAGGIYSTGIAEAQGQIRASGWWGSSSGAYGDLATEIGVSGGSSFIISYNRNTNSYGSLEFNATDIRLVPQGGTLTGPGGNVILHAGNYTNYITSSSNADTIDSWGFRNTGSNEGVNADTLDSNGITYYTGGVTNFSGNATDGALYSQRYSTSWQHQIAGDYRSGQIAVRGKNSGVWQSWYKVLQEDTWQGNKHFASDGRIYGTVFYDSNDTGYHSDLTSTADNAQRQRGGTLYGPNPSWGAYLYVGTNGRVGTTATVAVTNGNLHLDAQDGFDIYLNHYNGRWTRTNGLYDNQNTGYYLDPDSVSRLSTVNADTLRSYNNIYLDNQYGSSVVGAYSSYRYQGVFAMGDAYKLALDGTTTGSLYGLAWSHPNAGGIAGNLNTHGLLVLENGGFLAAISGSIRSRDDMRSPIFYDSNNTGYYVDPNGSSRFAGRIYSHEWIEMPNWSGLYSPNNGAHFHPNDSSYGSWKVIGTRNGWAGLEFSNSATSLMMNDNTYGFHRNGVGWKFYVEGGNGYFPGNVTAYWSDERLKENLYAIRRESLSILGAFTAYRFNWNSRVVEIGSSIPVGKEEIGLIAQHVQRTLPDAVVVNKAGAKIGETGFDYLTINYDRITPLLVEGVNIHEQDISDLKAEVAELRALLNKLLGV